MRKRRCRYGSGHTITSDGRNPYLAWEGSGGKGSGRGKGAVGVGDKFWERGNK